MSKLTKIIIKTGHNFHIEAFFSLREAVLCVVERVDNVMCLYVRVRACCKAQRSEQPPWHFVSIILFIIAVFEPDSIGIESCSVRSARLFKTASLSPFRLSGKII